MLRVQWPTSWSCRRLIAMATRARPSCCRCNLLHSSVALLLLLDRDLRGHPVREVRLAVLCVRQEADERVVARSEVSPEILGHSRVDPSNSTQRLSGWWTLHL